MSVNGPTVRRPFFGRTHVSQTRGTDPIVHGDVSNSGFLGHHRQNTGNRVGKQRQGGGFTGFLRKSRISHPLVPVIHRTHTSGDTGAGGLREAPSGYAYLINADNAFILNADGAYILVKV